MGLVSQVFQEKDLQQLRIGTRAIGHVRYSTSGSSTLKNAQPLVVDCARGQLAIAHNGNLVNAAVLREELESNGSIFQTTVDSEIILHLLARPTGRKNVLSALRLVEGAFSFVLMGEQEIIGVRDPFGFDRWFWVNWMTRLSWHPKPARWIWCTQITFEKSSHGEVVIINDDGIRSEWPFKEERKAFCIFEYVYFARPDSLINDRNVSKARVAMGAELAKLHPVDADIVVPVPDSGNYAALGFSHELNIPYEHAFVRNHYIGRTFLQPTQLIRDFNVRVKLNLIKELVKGKRVVVVDDSVVRGTTARARVVNLARSQALRRCICGSAVRPTNTHAITALIFRIQKTC